MAEVTELTDDDIRAAARHWLAQERWQETIARSVYGRLPGHLRRDSDTLADRLLETGAEGIGPLDSRRGEAELALESAGYPMPPYPPELLDRTASALADVLRQIVERRMQEVFQPEEATAAPMSPATPVSQAARKGPRVLDYVEDWQVALVTGWGDWKPIDAHSARQYAVAVKLFTEIIGNSYAGRIERENAASFRVQLLRLPATLGKGRPVHALKAIEQADRADVPRMTMKTVKRHVTAMNRYWDWLQHAGHLDAEQASPFKGHSFPGTKSRKSNRDDWSAEDLKRLLSSADYRMAPGASALHWLPLISLHSGMRLEEICRLRPAHDIGTENGVSCFLIQPHPDGWDPKSEAGERKVPIHSWLVRHGLLDLVARRRADGSERLFPDLRAGTDGKQGAEFSRSFSRLKTGIGIGPKTVFHSFRHTFRTVLESSDFRDRHIDAVMGHEGDGRSEGRTYAKRVLVGKLREVVEGFESPLPLDFLPPPDLAQRVVPPIRKRRLVRRQ
ncbi:site-specific integrase [Rhizobiales bacterium 3FA27D7]|jgi:integrase|uniref:site-specific integrase n=1 Tax=Mesorhizobium sp. 2RAF21 TaxID=3232995 RepID=UPI0014856149